MSDITLDSSIASELLDTMDESDMKELFKMYSEYTLFPTNTIDEEYKLEIVKQLFDKYSWVELEKKIKHLL